MPNWTTFDDESSGALRSRLPEPVITQLPANLALEHVLQRGETLVAVLPGGMLDQAALAVFRWNRVEPTPTPVRSANTRPGGFLGLSDEPAFEEEELQEKKSWWKRLWGE
ncbi:MAG TPA: hypothetical protein VI636_09215 [Candidatus Angelobacter sp.]